MKENRKVMETKMFSTEKEVIDYVNNNDDQVGFRYETHKIDDNIYKVEKQKVI